MNEHENIMEKVSYKRSHIMIPFILKCPVSENLEIESRSVIARDWRGRDRKE